MNLDVKVTGERDPETDRVMVMVRVRVGVRVGVRIRVGVRVKARAVKIVS